uniref:Bm3587 n=1 Tax=Brugia malayi TaxID=6279 RepID=A0A0J9XWZ8_BRUMA|nr:Bm3587 [Brugia malayi]
MRSFRYNFVFFFFFFSCSKCCSWPTSDKDRKKHTKDFISRALLECLYDKHKGDVLTFLNCALVFKYSIFCLTMTDLLNNSSSQSYHCSIKFFLTFLIVYSYCTYQFFQLLQTMMQTPLEMFVLLDRLFFLREHGYSAYILSVFNPKISSRHLCIIASPS